MMQNPKEDRIDFAHAIENMEKEAFLNGFRIGQHYGNDARSIRDLHKDGFKIEALARIYDMTADEVTAVLEIRKWE